MTENENNKKENNDELFTHADMVSGEVKTCVVQVVIISTSNKDIQGISQEFNFGYFKDYGVERIILNKSLDKIQYVIELEDLNSAKNIISQLNECEQQEDGWKMNVYPSSLEKLEINKDTQGVDYSQQKKNKKQILQAKLANKYTTGRSQLTQINDLEGCLDQLNINDQYKSNMPKLKKKVKNQKYDLQEGDEKSQQMQDQTLINSTQNNVSKGVLNGIDVSEINKVKQQNISVWSELGQLGGGNNLNVINQSSYFLNTSMNQQNATLPQNHQVNLSTQNLLGQFQNDDSFNNSLNQITQQQQSKSLNTSINGGKNTQQLKQQNGFAPFGNNNLSKYQQQPKINNLQQKNINNNSLKMFVNEDEDRIIQESAQQSNNNLQDDQQIVENSPQNTEQPPPGFDNIWQQNGNNKNNTNNQNIMFQLQQKKLQQQMQQQQLQGQQFTSKSQDTSFDAVQQKANNYNFLPDGGFNNNNNMQFNLQQQNSNPGSQQFLENNNNNNKNLLQQQNNNNTNNNPMGNFNNNNFSGMNSAVSTQNSASNSLTQQQILNSLNNNNFNNNNNNGQNSNEIGSFNNLDSQTGFTQQQQMQMQMQMQIQQQQIELQKIQLQQAMLQGNNNNSNSSNSNNNNNLLQGNNSNNNNNNMQPYNFLEQIQKQMLLQQQQYEQKLAQQQMMMQMQQQQIQAMMQNMKGMQLQQQTPQNQEQMLNNYNQMSGMMNMNFMDSLQLNNMNLNNTGSNSLNTSSNNILQNTSKVSGKMFINEDGDSSMIDLTGQGQGRINPEIMKAGRKSKVIYGRWFEKEKVDIKMLINMFSSFGNIYKMIYMKEKLSCLIEYKQVEHARLAKESLNEIAFFGQEIKVFYSNYEEVYIKPQKQRNDKFSNDNLEEYFIGSEENWRFGQDIEPQYGLNVFPPCESLMVCNVPANSPELIKQHFQPIGCIKKIDTEIDEANQKMVNIFVKDTNNYNQNGSQLGCYIVSYDSKEIALETLSLKHGIEIQGNTVHVMFAKQAQQLQQIN